MTEQTRRYDATLEAAIRFARVTAEYGKTAKVRAEAAARLAELEAVAKTR
jgi:hypothetical protein